MMKKRIVFFVLSMIALVLLLAPALAAQGSATQQEEETITKSKRANAYYLRSVDYMKKGKMEKARSEAEACLEISPSFADAHLLLARLDYQEGDLDSALKRAEAAKSSFTAFSKFRGLTRQEYLDHLRQEREKRREYLDSLKERVASPNISSQERSHIQMEINEVSQQLTEADMQLTKPISSEQDIPADYHFIYGNILFKLKRLDQAREAYLAAVSADPRHANAYNNLINICFVRGDVAGAVKYLQQAEANGVMVNEKLKQAVLEKQPTQ